MQGTLVLLFYFAINCRMQQCELELDIPFHYSKVTRTNWVDFNTKLVYIAILKHFHFKSFYFNLVQNEKFEFLIN